MSSTNINMEFAKFGSRMNTIAILTLISFILTIAGAFVPIVGYIALVLSLIIIIFFLLVLGNIKRAGRELSNSELLAFTPRFLFGTIIRFVGQILMSIIEWFYIGNVWLMLIIELALIIVGSVLRYKAWSGLATFFETNSQLFPTVISTKGYKGAKLCKIATILDMTIILSFIGEILRVIGYFKLATTKNLVGAPAQPMYQPTAPQPTPTPATSTSSINFCPNCGSSISSGSRFCPECGSEIT